MGKGFIKINTDIALTWLAEGRTKEDIKDLLQLPDRYTVEELRKQGAFRSYEGSYKGSDDKFTDHPSALEVIVSSSDIPEIPRGDGMHAEIMLNYAGNLLGSVTIDPLAFGVEYARWDEDKSAYMPIHRNQKEEALEGVM